MANSKKALVEGVPIFCQYPTLPTGCEASALTMVLLWMGLRIDKERVAHELPKELKPAPRDNKIVGGNPNCAFVGDPFDKDSFGTFHGPITAALQRYLPQSGCDLTGSDFSEVLKVVESGRPVIVWFTLELREPKITDVWHDVADESTIIEWQSPEHCAVLVGFVLDQEKRVVMVNDPHTGRQEQYDIDLFKKRWEQLGRQAVTVAEGTNRINNPHQL